ncbi:MAG TPA: cation-transporting P-type ATPase, partial [Candidatus Bathyarchaeia archaeon]|nr:cation-transporting P-type ATPase [Candidatus Bathyarchaeia archaeon]
MQYGRAALEKIEDLYGELETGPEGLSDQESKLRLTRFGPNVLPRGKKVGLAGRLASQFKNMFNVLLLIASFLSFLSAIAFGDSGSLQMGLAILAVVFINAFFSLFQEYRAERAAHVIGELIPKKAKVIRGGEVKEVDATEIVPGDVLALEEGDR